MDVVKPKVAALYIRVSTSRQEAENQKLQLLPYCEKQGYTVYQIYSDIMSGAENRRPAFDKMFRDAHDRRFDLVLFWSLDRFSRSGLDFTVQKLQELKNTGVDWESYTESYMKTMGPFGDVVLAIMSTLAKVERQRLSERTKAGLARKMATGWRPGRRKGVKDTKPRKRDGYLGQQNWRGMKKGVSATDPRKVPETTIEVGAYAGHLEEKDTSVYLGDTSVCCRAAAYPAGGVDGSRYWVCDKCRKTCEIERREE